MTPLRLLTEPISRAELSSLADEGYGDMVKAVVDVRREIMAIGESSIPMKRPRSWTTAPIRGDAGGR